MRRLNTLLTVRPLIALTILTVSALPGFAQHEGHEGHEGHDMSTMSADSAAAPQAPVDHALHVMPNILHEPIGSGTAWLPAGTNVHEHATHFMLGDWMVMAHGEAIIRYTSVNLNNKSRWRSDSTPTAGTSDYPNLERGGRMIDMPNWAMVSAQRSMPGGGTLLLRSMLSLDPVTVGRQGYPLLYQTGEGLVDRQHPHDLFMELGALYAQPLTAHQTVFAYAGLPGEPALGPTAFMHRPSIGGNPDAPLGHHFQDATHITHGVLTAGYILYRTKLDASLFRGREPDQDRLGIDAGALDSWSVRLTQNLRQWSLQASYAAIHAPEPDSHDDVHRTTVALTRNRTVYMTNPMRHANTVVWGMNAGHHGTVAHSLLHESSLTGKRWQFWSRWEVLQREGAELDLIPPDDDAQYWVYGFALGVGGSVLRVAGTEFFLGAQGGLNLHDDALIPYYGEFPLSGQVFLKIRPGSALAKKTSVVDAPLHEHEGHTP
jgi:hypothetical protein